MRRNTFPPANELEMKINIFSNKNINLCETKTKLLMKAKKKRLENKLKMQII